MELTALPDELVRKILTNVNVADVLAMGRSNIFLYKISRDTGFWRDFFREKFPLYPHLATTTPQLAYNLERDKMIDIMLHGIPYTFNNNITRTINIYTTIRELDQAPPYVNLFCILTDHNSYFANYQADKKTICLGDTMLDVQAPLYSLTLDNGDNLYLSIKAILMSDIKEIIYL